MKQRSDLKAFTLVELIVVITIIGILSTIGFVSYSGYLSGARDSNRISQIVKLSDSLEVYGSTKNLPLPDNYVTVVASGATNIIGYQGTIGVDVLETIDYSNGGKDPKDDTYYTYYLSKDRSDLQIMAFMEESASSLAQVWDRGYAIDYSERYPRILGKNLGILVSNATATKNTPLQELGVTTLDVVTTGSGFDAYLTSSEKLSGTGVTLRGIIPNASCKRIKETGGGTGGSGIYSINPAGAGSRDAYCEMQEAGGGWTLMARSAVGGGGTFTAGTATGSLTDLTKPYIQSSANLTFTELMMARYTGASQRVIDSGIFKRISGTTITHVVGTSTLGAGIITDGTDTNYGGKQGMIFVK